MGAPGNTCFQCIGWENFSLRRAPGYVAQASALATVSSAKNSGLRMLYDALNVTRGDQKARLDYVQSLLNNPATTLHVGYETRFLASGK